MKKIPNGLANKKIPNGNHHMTITATHLENTFIIYLGTRPLCSSSISGALCVASWPFSWPDDALSAHVFVSLAGAGLLADDLAFS